MASFIRDKKVSIICHIVMAVAVLPLVLMYSKKDTFLWINGQNHHYLDIIMYHITQLPELALIVFVVVLALFDQKRNLLAVILSMAVCGLMMLLFKEYLFDGMSRPSVWLLGDSIPFHKVQGIELHSMGTFPSGHTMSAFCALGMAGFMSRNGWAQFILFILALLAGYSRIYVSQHFLPDVYTGALCGYFLGLLFFFVFSKIFKTDYWLIPLIAIKK